jgi:hypothetical protein
VNTSNDPSHCGACYAACSSGQVCTSGSCALQCSGGTTKCGSVCVDTKYDPSNCGACGNSCGNNDGLSCTTGFCSNGTCSGNTTTTTIFSTTSVTRRLTLAANGRSATAPGSDPRRHHADADNGASGPRGRCADVAHSMHYLTSPVIDTSAATTLYLQFRRWLDSDYTPYMENQVEVFNGTTWVTIWNSGSSGGYDTSWQSLSYDISAHKHAAMQVRFGFSIGSTAAFSCLPASRHRDLEAPCLTDRSSRIRLCCRRNA